MYRKVTDKAIDYIEVFAIPNLALTGHSSGLKGNVVAQFTGPGATASLKTKAKYHGYRL
jgi:hypothetical protein